MKGVVDVEVGGERLCLLPQRAAWWPAQGCLLVADVHLGKAATFRRLGVPVPRGTTGATLDVLDGLVEATGCRRVVVLGDLMHSKHATAPDALQAVARWRGRRPALALTLVEGNHDRHSGDPPADWGVEVVQGPLRLGGLALVHEPVTVPGAYALAGHLHPAVRLGGAAHDRLRLPCFHFGPTLGVLPAFGAFTGAHVVKPARGDRVFVVAGDEVRSLPVGRVGGLTTLQGCPPKTGPA